MRSVGLNILLMAFASLASALVPKKCSAPPKYPNTRLADNFVNKNTFNAGDKVRYTCAQDFTPSSTSGGSPIVQCEAKGTWTKLSLKCEKISCGNVGELPNGEFHYGDSSFIGEKVYAVCNDGYTLKGQNYMICKNSGWAGDFPICEEAASTCPAPAVAHSEKSAGSVYQEGQKLTITCSPGFQLEGSPHVTCGPGGEWQPKLPQCLPWPFNDQPMPGKSQPAPGKSQPAPGKSQPAPGKSQPTPAKKQPAPGKKQLGPGETDRCGPPPSVGNAIPADKYLMTATFASGDRVYYVCDVGYYPSSGNRFRTCDDGEWTKLELTCARKSCGSAGEILNGQFIYTGVEFGDIATAVCNEGYVLVGKDTRHCMDKGWDGRIPLCEAVVCSEPQEVENAVRTGLKEPPYTYSSVLTYKCTKGTLVGQREIWCTKFGTWSSAPPVCKDISCPAPNMANAYWIGAQHNTYEYGDTLIIECQPNYVLIGAKTVTCGINGRWIPALPRCGQKQWRSFRHGS